MTLGEGLHVSRKKVSLVDRNQCSYMFRAGAVGSRTCGRTGDTQLQGEPPCRLVEAPGRRLDLIEFRSAIF